MASARLHIASGDPAAGALQLALECEPSAILVHHDSLSCGPLPPFRSLDEWRSVRERFWTVFWAFDPPAPRFADWPNDVLQHAHELRGCREVTLWVGSGVSEQLLVPWTVRLLEIVEAPLSALSVVQFGREPTRGVETTDLGMLSVEQLRAHPGARPVTEGDLEELRRVWAAVTAPDPYGLLRLGAASSGAFPLLVRAIATMRDGFPEARTGLAHWDRELLEHTRANGPRVARIIGHTLACENSYLDPIGDLYLFARLFRLADAGLPHPLISLVGDASSLRGCEARLTPMGEEVLAGRHNLVELNGIDEWVGGVHLDSAAGRVWVRDGDALLAWRQGG